MYEEHFVETPEEKVELLYRCFQILRADLLEHERTAKKNAKGFSPIRRTVAWDLKERVAAEGDDDEIPAGDEEEEAITPAQLVFALQVIDPVAQTNTTTEQLEAIVAAELLLDAEEAASGRISIFHAAQYFRAQAEERVVKFADMCVMFEGKPVNPECAMMLNHALHLKKELTRYLVSSEKEEEAARRAITKQEADAVAGMASQLRRATHISQLRAKMQAEFQAGKRALDADAHNAASQADAKRLLELKQEQQRVKAEGKQYLASVTQLEEQAAKVEEDMIRYHEQIRVLTQWKDVGIKVAQTEAGEEWKKFVQTLNARYEETNAALDRVEEKIVDTGRDIVRASLARGFDTHRQTMSEWFEEDETYGSGKHTTPRKSPSPGGRGGKLPHDVPQKDTSRNMEWLAIDESGLDPALLSQQQSFLPGGQSPQGWSASGSGAKQNSAAALGDPWLMCPDPLLDGSVLTEDVVAGGDNSLLEFTTQLLQGLTSRFFTARGVDMRYHSSADTDAVPCMTYSSWKAFVTSCRLDVPGSLAITFVDAADLLILPPLNNTTGGTNAGDLQMRGVESADGGFSSAGMLDADGGRALKEGGPSEVSAIHPHSQRGMSLLALRSIVLDLASLKYGPHALRVSKAFLLDRFVRCYIQPELGKLSGADDMSMLEGHRDPSGFAGGGAMRETNCTLFEVLFELHTIGIPTPHLERFAAQYHRICQESSSLQKSPVREALVGAQLIPSASTQPSKVFHRVVDDQKKIYFSDLLFNVTNTEGHVSDAPLDLLCNWMEEALSVDMSHSLLKQRLLSAANDLLEQTVGRCDGKMLEPLEDFWQVDASLQGAAATHMLDNAGSVSKGSSTSDGGGGGGGPEELRMPLVLFLAVLTALAGHPPLPPLPQLVKLMIGQPNEAK